ncbi:SDR family NAD(P)-dependent oxidoreductase [Burkholderia gladioli]|uniref:SDR family NAD(P)-dependent oxidoreductase n=1 Tax=Burkholderia gladioli TaxID=28095 RepID=UPI0026506185|nr:SDR family NAD(P)-dependent oxidoreductase [Burkholderia gladioli]MDN7714925.1 SDR family NAD(P)-dependent oxidoreductase [Burkholderia gladioli]
MREVEKIAVVTGASRGAGKGIALALGAAGMTVYVTARSVADGDSPHGGTIGQTAEQVGRAGGKGIAVAVDHADDAAVAAFFQRIAREHGRLDILVNNAANLASAPTAGGFWTKPLASADLLEVGLRSHFVSSYHAAPLLIANGRGLIVNTGHYGAQKAGSDKMAADMAKELRPYNVSANAIWMGGLDTERARAYLDSLAPEARPAAKRESPRFTGRVIAALYACEHRMALSGRALIGAELGALLGVTDVDGSRPISYRYTMGGPPELHPSLSA